MFKNYLFILLITGIGLLQFQCTLPDPIDDVAPIVAVIYPFTGSVLSDTIDIIVEASDENEVERIWYYFDGVLMEARNATSASFQLDVSPYADGNAHVIQAVARDKSGNRGFSPQITVTIATASDITPPTLVLLYPAVPFPSVGSVDVVVDVFDANGVDRVEFYIDGILTETDTQEPWGYTLNISSLSLTDHTFYIKAYDTFGNVGALGPYIIDR